MASKFVAVFASIGVLAALAGYVGTAYVFFNTGRDLLGVIALFVPPADVVLSFVANPVLGVLGIGGMILAYGGFILSVSNE